ncbi:2-polyprenyl-6-methoxyphenol hydroxylase [Kibdelosporangium aridum]|uniref:2-polyprenyl-6-methoxyphenol hydroxylase n=1 Tax=Kibdelosporangium aridum TaxID=2030 RepID=A0A1Y5Y964_KIBAR|nr:2-polyprenyl-6-methoxyphenol hydroxylase [Kibdelosporangium aridum]
MAVVPASTFARLSNPSRSTTPSMVLGTATVLGGSVAGLLAARVLSDHAASVLIIERDEPDAGDDQRNGVPQGFQIHALLPGGLSLLERWFPGFTEQVIAAGACAAPATARRTYIDGVRKVIGSAATMLTGSRAFLEGQIRERVLALPNVKAITARVTDVVFDGDAVSGVSYESSGMSSVERSDLVIDAMGKSSRMAEWLEKKGWERPPLRRMVVDLNYATAVLRREEGDPAGNIHLALKSGKTSGDASGAMFCRIEGDRWLMMMAGYQDRKPGRTAEDLLRVARQEFPPEFELVADNELVEEIRTYRHADSRRRDYHLVSKLPARLVAVGDAVAAFNPVYGQGMSSAALHASCLSEYLCSEPELAKPARAFFALQRVVVDAAWDISTGADLALPHVDGPYPRGYPVLRWVRNQISAASVYDREIGRRFDEVTYMIQHPSSLARPGVLARAIAVNLWSKFRSRP